MWLGGSCVKPPTLQHLERQARLSTGNACPAFCGSGARGYKGQGSCLDRIPEEALDFAGRMKFSRWARCLQAAGTQCANLGRFERGVLVAGGRGGDVSLDLAFQSL